MIEKIKSLKNNRFFLPILLLLVALPTVLGIIGPSLYSLHDDMHPAWLYEMDRALKGGQYPPRWAPDLSFNFGYPLFNFVYPLPFYLAEVFYLAGFSLVGAVKIVFALSLLFSGLTMFLFLKRNFGNLFSFLGATLYIYTPYRAVDVYVRGAIGEALSFVFIPLVAYAVDRLVKEKGRINIALLGISFALLILSHNIAFLMATPFLFFYGAVLLLLVKEKLKVFFQLVSGFVLGASISSFFWLPAFWEKRLMAADTVFNFQDHFPFIKQLIYSPWGYGTSFWGPNDEMSFQIGIVNLLAVVIITVGFVWLKRLPLFVWGMASLGIVLFLMNIRSGFIWNKVSLLPYFQFPWRFLILTTFLTPFLVALIEKIPISVKVKQIIAISFLILAPVLTFSYFKPEKPLPERTDDYFMHRYFANKTKTGYTQEISPVYLTLKEEYLRLPLWTEVRPSALPAAKIEAKIGELTFLEKTPTYFIAQIKTLKETSIVFHSYYYPGWEAFLDGAKIEVSINQPHGDMLIKVPEGQHEIIFKFNETDLRRFANLFSLGALTLALFFVLKRRKK